MSKTKISTGLNTWFDPTNVSVFTGTEWARVNKVRVYTGTEWVEVWPVGFPNSGTLDADYWVITVWFRSSDDFDIRVFGCDPDIGQDDTTLIGWGQSSYWPVTGTPVLTWGGDYIGPGVDGLDNRKLSCETVLVDVNQYRTQYPTATEIKLVVRGFYFTPPAGDLGVVVGAVGYVGTIPVNQSPYYWTVSDATETLELQQDPEGIVVNLTTQDPATTGEYMATFRYNLTTHLADFVLDEAGCPIPEAVPGPSGGALYYTATAGSVIGLIDFVRDPVEDWATGFTITEKQIVTVPAGTFGAVPVPTKVSVQWVDTIQVLYYIEYVYAIPWSGPFPPAGYTGVNVSYNGSIVYDPTVYNWDPTLNQFEPA